MIKGNCAQRVVPRRGEKFNSFGLLRCPCWSIIKMWLLLYWEIYRPFFEIHHSVLRIVMAFLFRVLRKTNQKTAKDDLEWRMHEVMGIVCGTMFSKERVHNLVDLLSRVLVTFSVGQISALVTVTHFCCNLLLQMLECYWTCSHARLACFLFETNPLFVGSARIAGLCLWWVTVTAH